MLLDSTSPDGLIDKVRYAYSEASDNPTGSHPFPLGFDFALSLGYPEELLRRLPQSSVERFTGVSNVSVFTEVPAGSTVLDLGCGAGTDSLIAAGKTGPGGRVFGVDFSLSMLAHTRAGTAEAGASNLEFREAEGQRLPFDDGTFDVALVNGIFNLNPSRNELFQELVRVIRPGGALYGAEIILSDPMDDEKRTGLASWFS